MNVLICKHHPQEGPGVFGDVLDEKNIKRETLDFFRDPLAKPEKLEHTHLLIMGGPMNVDQTEAYPYLLYERELIRHFIGQNRPVLGICLGAQLIARTLGADVYSNRPPEVGWSPIELTSAGEKDPLLSGFNRTEPVFQWHGDTYDLPQNGIWLAKSEICAHQAFRCGNKTYALQFHLEATPAMLASWMAGEDDKKAILQQTSLYGSRANEIARMFFLQWLALG